MAKEKFCPEPDRIHEYAETTHHEYDLGVKAGIHDIEFLIQCESEAYGMFFIIQCVDKKGNLQHYRTFVLPLDEKNNLIKDLHDLTRQYKCVEIENIILVFILEE